jgi:bacteriocin biosynthesis cyclodehydratase domain-containing protein
VRELYEAGLVEDALDDQRLREDERIRYDRQLRYFGDVIAPKGSRARCQERLRDARVVVLGLGGLGSWAVYGLACAGVGEIDGVDGDDVELSNLNRQILYGEQDIGTAKAGAAASRLAAFNSASRFRGIARMLRSADDVEEVIAGADFVIDAVDWPPHEIERWINTACFRLRIPYLTMSQFPPLVRIGPTYIPGVTGCWTCQEQDIRDRFPLFDAVAAQRASRPSPAATFGPACGLVGSQAALEVVHHLSGVCDPVTAGRAFVFDLRSFAVSSHEAPRLPGCPTCAPPATPYRPSRTRGSSSA